MNQNILTQIIMSSKTFKCYQIFPNPLKLDIANYDYSLKILTVQFSNVIPNVNETLYVENDVVIGPGIYEIDDIVAAYNNLSVYGALSVNYNTGKMLLKNNTGAVLTINSSSFLSNKICGMFNLPITLNQNEQIESTTSPVIQDFNYFVLTSPNVNGYTQTSKDGQGFTPNNTLWPFSSAIAPFKFKTWTSLQPVEFKIDGDTLNYMEFELKTADGLSITNQLADSDFMVCAQIVQYAKHTEKQSF